MMIESIKDKGRVIATIVYKNFDKPGIEFLTPDTFPLQLGHMKHPSGHVIEPHVHNPFRRDTYGTQEVLFIKKGIIQINFYSFDKDYLESRILHEGDFILLVGAGHGIKIIEEATLVEVKNGPYYPEKDKERFEDKTVDSHIPFIQNKDTFTE